ncbi:N-acetylglucosamine kinase-like BadF-type ATPase [Actinocorallia herbida]|uniref:N-acetylglucosamine kinase-like BadF-type ATPase n=1 Tax=Actinocorallia herbida TaxID=58109 RepID=A0A3N1D8U1_9ACTN|nr:BadF/BadG/BcrA/BcrD ATPase family protein [Actinocorallia herbida]ROO89953.1 N-acetylglucosamine kinase-like BadF-type ATPase [Actinocorallia herbida]
MSDFASPNDAPPSGPLCGSEPYVVGIDAGGTHTRCALATLDGTVVGEGRGPGANPNSGGDPEKALGEALSEAMSGVDPSAVRGGVFGIAGAGAAGRPVLVSASQRAWEKLGIAGQPEVFTDIAINFASGTTAASGIVVFAGTGAGAAVIRDGEIVARADAYGYLLGDEGSAVWIGRQGVKAALAAMDGRGPETLLADLVPEALLGREAALGLRPRSLVLAGSGQAPTGFGRPAPPATGLPQAILKEVYGAPPAALGKVGPVVSEAASLGDEVALRIVYEAADSLLLDVDAIMPALGDPDSPVVMAGSVLSGGMVAELVRAGLRERFSREPCAAGDGAAGAARMAIRRLSAA